jgi:hypothetical protein
MSDLPPPPLDPDRAFQVPVPRPAAAPARRPGPVTGAAAVLMIAGAFSLVAGLLWASGERVNIDFPFLEGEFERIAAFVLVVQGVLALVAGWLVLRLRPAGRVLGIVLSSLAIVAGLAQLRSAGSSGLLGLALNAFVLYALFTYGFVFKSGRSPG